MITAGKIVFLIIDILAVAALAYSVYRGYKHGGRRALFSFLGAVAIALISFLGARVLSSALPLIPASWIKAGMETAAGSPVGDDLVLFVRRMAMFMIYYIVIALILYFVTDPLITKLEGSGRSRDITLINRILGVAVGILTFTFWSLMASVILLTGKSSGVIVNGNDLVYQTALQYPVNYVGKPLTSLAGNSRLSDVWQNGIVIYPEDQENLNQWLQENGFDSLSSDN